MNLPVSTALTLCMLAAASITAADCIDVVDEASELPHQVTTPGGVDLTYAYDLKPETYSVAWRRGDQAGGPYGPFTLTRGCMPAVLEWESDAFVLLQAGCGTFCWYVLVVPLSGEGDVVTVDRPLAFHAGRNLLATYHDKDVIRVSNLLTGRSQDITTVHTCESWSGVCFTEVKMDDTHIEYTWMINPDGEVITAALDERVTGVAR